MNTQARRALVATTVGLAMAASMSSTPVATAGSAAAKPSKLSAFGLKGTAEGIKLYVNNVQVKTLKDGVAPLRCTRKIGRDNKARSLLSTPEDFPLLDLSAATSRTVSYRDGDRVGVRATSVMGDITVGDLDLGTPVLVIKGLTTVADAFHDKKGYGHEESISELDLEFQGLPEEINEPLQMLLDALDEGVAAIVDVLQEVGAPIEIPDLGTIALSGRTKGKDTKHHAESDSAALEIAVTATGETTKLLLGHARARIGGPAPAGVFRSTSMPMEVDVLDGLARFGGVRPRTIPCEGTDGIVRTRELGSASVLLPQNLLAGVTGIKYSYAGKQHRDGTAKGFNSQDVGTFTIDQLGLRIEGIKSKVVTKKVRSAKSPTGYKVVSKPSFDVAKLVYNDQEYAIPNPGELLEIDGLGVVESRVVEATKWGKRVTALRLTLTEFGDTKIDLGISASQIFSY